MLTGGAALACASLAGCNASQLPGFGAGSDGDGMGSGRTYDAGAVFDVETAMVASADVQAVLDAPVPEFVYDEVDRLDESYESVEPGDFDALDVSGFQDHEDSQFGFTAVLSGDYDVEGLRDELLEDGSLEAAGEYRGTERYRDRNEAIALADGAVVLGGGMGEGVQMRLVDSGLDVLADEAPAFGDRENGATLQGALSGDVTGAVDLGADVHEEVRSGFEDSEFASVIEATTAFGVDATFHGGTTDMTYVLVAAEDELDVETVRDVADAIEDSEESTIQDVSVSRDGRAILASAEVETRELFESHTAALEALGPHRHDRVDETAPNATFGFSYADGVLEVMHDGGDSVRAGDLYLTGDVTYETGDGSWAETGGTGDVVTAGTSVAVGGSGSGYAWAGQPGEGEVRVLWDADGSTPTTMGVWER